MTSRKNRGDHRDGWWIALGTIILLVVFVAGVVVWSIVNSTSIAYVN